jgi:hypothetical protein
MKLYHFLLLFTLLSCVSQKKTPTLRSDYLTYEKVKIKIKSLTYNGQLKGYISISNVDTSICFRFFGPLGIPVTEGYLHDSLLLKDLINNKNYFDILNDIKKSTEISLSPKFLFSILSFNDSLMVSEIDHNNRLSIRNGNSFFSGKRFYVIEDRLNKKMVEISFINKKSLPYALIIKYPYLNEFITIEFTILDISSRRKICNFED